ncbi:ATP-binding cassette domain-containing protein [Clostridium bornimense]|uniref:ABC transporter ATP-binding protein n=1 Tax=Clostridium bornimense TaxID=1216932 RepID=UPI001C102A1F|nr:ATP-binding cassette domain-containing protein [Clostridium bornimense]MBU5317165.1 ATP-binding cassette domain-containing protein [Clostridium bornimense]
MLKVKNLSKKFKAFTAVDNISFEVKSGEIVGLLGENGAGKTTTMRVIATMMTPSTGDVEVNNFSITKEPDKARKNLGVLFGGDVGLYDRLTARENIAYFAELNGLSKSEIEERIKYVAKACQITDFMDKKAKGFSRGMRQKVSIARSIVHDPKVMLFDEPTTGLDISAARSIHDFIKDCKREGKAILLSSHSMYEVEKLCDRVIMMHKGKVIESGTLDEIRAKYNNPDLEEVFVNLIGGENNE